MGVEGFVFVLMRVGSQYRRDTVSLGNWMYRTSIVDWCDYRRGGEYWIIAGYNGGAVGRVANLILFVVHPCRHRTNHHRRTEYLQSRREWNAKYYFLQGAPVIQWSIGTFCVSIKMCVCLISFISPATARIKLSEFNVVLFMKYLISFEDKSGYRYWLDFFSFTICSARTTTAAD